MATLSRQRSWSGLFVVALLAAVAGGFFGFRAITDTTNPRAPATATRVRVFVPEAEYAERSPHVDSSLNITGIQGSVRGASPVPPPDQPPIAARDFNRPVAAYIRYSIEQLRIMQHDLVRLRAALRSGDRPTSKAAWEQAWARYLRIGGVYLQGNLAHLNQAIDGDPGGLPGGTSSPEFTGLHRIEFGLWTGASPASLVVYAQRLQTDVAAMSKLLPVTRISPLEFVTRTHEILEDAVRDLLSGNDVPWSQEGVLGTQAGVYATRELIATLRPLLKEPPVARNDPPANPRSPAVVDSDLTVLQNVLNSLAAAHGGELPTNRQLSQEQSERLDAAVGQALEGLSQIPGLLETVVPPPIPRIPARARTSR